MGHGEVGEDRDEAGARRVGHRGAVHSGLRGKPASWRGGNRTDLISEPSLQTPGPSPSGAQAAGLGRWGQEQKEEAGSRGQVGEATQAEGTRHRPLWTPILTGHWPEASLGQPGQPAWASLACSLQMPTRACGGKLGGASVCSGCVTSITDGAAETTGHHCLRAEAAGREGRCSRPPAAARVTLATFGAPL